jgi:hypothetical protein
MEAPMRVGIMRKFGVFLFLISKYEATKPNTTPKGRNK